MHLTIIQTAVSLSSYDVHQAQGGGGGKNWLPSISDKMANAKCTHGWNDTIAQGLIIAFCYNVIIVTPYKNNI